MFAGIRTRTFGILKHKGGVITTFLHQGEGKLVILFRFRVETGEYIRRQSTIRNDTANGINTLQIPLTSIFTVHQFQYTATPALYGQMYMLAYIGNFRYDLQRFITHIFGVGSSETDADTRSSPGYYAQQHGKGYHFSIRLLKTVRVDILPQQGHFLITLGHQIGHFIQNTLHIAATLASAGIGNDAVRAEIVTATHNGDKTRYMISTNTRRYHIAISFRCGELHINGFLPCLYGSYQIGQSEISIRTYHQVDMVIRNQIVLDALRHASQHTDNQVLFLLLERMKKFQTV